MRRLNDQTWERYYERWLPVAVKRVVPALLVAAVVCFVLALILI